MDVIVTETQCSEAPSSNDATSGCALAINLIWRQDKLYLSTTDEYFLGGEKQKTVIRNPGSTYVQHSCIDNDNC